mmetsp:Transcript_20275/g.40480  ORF Transcript_20275/g.40480 Transcript_20275/m.40480 type:complete len:212 (+) Transcript_20275:217-852(+)
MCFPHEYSRERSDEYDDRRRRRPLSAIAPATTATANTEQQPLLSLPDAGGYEYAGWDERGGGYGGRGSSDDSGPERPGWSEYGCLHERQCCSCDSGMEWQCRYEQYFSQFIPASSHLLFCTATPALLRFPPSLKFSPLFSTNTTGKSPKPAAATRSTTAARTTTAYTFSRVCGASKRECGPHHELQQHATSQPRDSISNTTTANTTRKPMP